MTDSGMATDDLLRRAKAGDGAALGELFAHYRDRLRKMVRLRLDRRLAGRLDASDVLQEAYLDVARRFPEYAAAPEVPFYVWLRALTGQRLIDLHRQHLGAKMRDAGQEVSLYRGALPQASSASLAQQLLTGQIPNAASSRSPNVPGHSPHSPWRSPAYCRCNSEPQRSPPHPLLAARLPPC